MKKLCPTCLTELEKKQRQCPICGTKQRRSYKKALRMTTFLLAPLLLVALILSYINHNHSATAVQEKFANALANRDDKTLKKLVIHEDSTAITSVEAKAITKLIEEIGEVEVEKLFYPTKNNRFLSIHKMTSKTVSLANIKEPLHLSITGSDQHKLVPGKYNVTISYEDTLKSVLTKKIVVTKKETPVHADIHFRKTSVKTETAFPITAFNDISIKMNGQTSSLEELAKKQEIQVFNYQLPTYTIQVKLPWGNIIGEKQKLAQSIDVTNIPLLNKAQQKKITELLHTTIQNMKNDTVDEKVFTKTMAGHLPTLRETGSHQHKITYLEGERLLVTKNLETAGVSVAAYTSLDEMLYAYVIYDKKTANWKIDFLTGEIFESQELDTLDVPEMTYIDPSYAPIDITNFSESQLNFFFNSEYFFQLQLAAYPEFTRKNDIPKTYHYLKACEKSSYEKTFVKKVDILDDNLVQIHSEDTCVTGEVYQATSILKRNGTSNWFFKELKPRKLIKQP